MRLIDADALKRAITEYHNGLKPHYISKLVDAEIADIQDIIDEQTTIDAVPVVRCKDCVAVSVCNDELVCERISEVMDGYYRGTVEVVKPDDYCSKGIRRSCARMDGGEERQ